MAKKEKQLEKIKNNPNNVSFEELSTLAKRYGCEVKERSKGSHFAIWHPGSPKILTIPRKKPIKKNYILDVIKFIEEVSEE